MKIQFKLIGISHEIWAYRNNTMGKMPVMQPNKHIISFVSMNVDINVDITVDERHKLSARLADQMRNNIFEFDFG